MNIISSEKNMISVKNNTMYEQSSPKTPPKKHLLNRTPLILCNLCSLV